jgi:hypothetical protein
MTRASQHSEGADHGHADDLAALLQAVLESAAVTEPAIRAAAYRGDKLPPPLSQYVAKVQRESYRITDADTQALLAAGYSPDAVFEVTVAAALGAAMWRLQAGLDALRQAR